MKKDLSHIKDERLKGKTCLEHGCGVVWYDSGQKEIRYWLVCEKYHHAFNGETQYKEIPKDGHSIFKSKK